MEMKLYVFTDENDEIITQSRARTHDEAVEQASGWGVEVDSNTAFYSTDAA